MSLIVSSNDTLGDKNYDRFATNQAPYRFTNHLVSPLEIPADSEVAVHSFKCNKDGLVKLSPTLNWYQFFNVDLRKDNSTPKIDSIDNSTGWAIKCFPKLNTTKRDEYVSLYDFADRIQSGMRVGIPHPDFVSKTDPLTTMEILRDSGTTGAGFKGFRLKYKYQNASGLSDTNFPTSFKRLFPDDGTNRIQYDDSTQKIKALVGKGAGDYEHTQSQKNCMFASDKPLSRLGGVLEYDLREMGTKNINGSGTYTHTSFNKDFQVGLNRGVPEQGGLFKSRQAGYNGGANAFSEYDKNPFDYACSCEQIGGTGNRWLKVGHLGQDPIMTDPENPLAMNDIQYFKGQAPLEWTDSNFQTGTPTNAPDDIGRYNMSSNASHFDTLEFKIENEIVSISFLRKYSTHADGSNAGTGDSPAYPLRVLITSYSMKTSNPNGIHKNCYPKPAGQTCWNLYPKVVLPFKNQEVRLAKYNGRTTGFNMEDPVSDWYCRSLIEGQVEAPLIVDQRFYNDTTDATEYSFKGVGGSGATAHFSHYVMNVVLAPQTLNYTNTAGANAQYVFGFIARGVLDTDNGVRDDSNQEIYYDSDSTPSIQAKDSMFIRLDNFTQKSFNAGTGRPSKIIHHLPRFDTSNREVGSGLYFEPNSMTYLKLGNTNPIVINELDFSICNSREQLITDLTGETIICLHFRKSPKM